MTDLLLEHPAMASFLQRALHGDPRSTGNRLIKRWLDQRFAQGVETLADAGPADADRADLAIRTIAIFNLTTGYFTSQRIFASLVEGGGS